MIYTNLNLKKMIKPLVLVFFFLALMINVNAQGITPNSIKAPAVVSSNEAFKPGIIIGSAVIIKDNQGYRCPDATYEWQSASDEYFTQNFTTNLAKTKDYDPGTVTTTTYFRRVVTIACINGPETVSKCGGIKITIN
ncbi:MAG: hypothetical protein WCO13_03705 [Bacteroidota bacterium]